MASTSNPQLEELAPSTSTSTSTTAFVRYEPPTTKLAFQSDKRYHVFLSFRGEDVRKTLIDHLFQALSTAGLNVFIDSEKLGKGEIIGLSLERAIESSAIRIPIFSKGYADSAWCLKEAAAMLKTPALIIPLFYYVDPTHVRYPQGNNSPYKKSFEKHYGHSDRYRREEIDEWKNALEKICSHSGWSMDITQGFEARLIKTVVNDLIKTLDRVPFQVAKHPVGLNNVSKLLIRKLNLNSADGVVRVGIWGIGGIGKTTVAKAVYNQIYTDFEAASFVSNVRSIAADGSGLTNLQKQILKDLIKNEETVNNVDEGISLFRDRLGGKRVLLILDDVDAVEQLNALVGDWLAPGSKVVITSRDKQILIVAPMPSKCIYEMSGLEMNEGLQLFSWHAFLRASPHPSYNHLCTKIVEACKGHPLSLEVIGSFLYGKQDDTGCWMEALHNITLNPQIHKRLYISYSALSDDEKEIFVDIACFFIGKHKRLLIVFWKSLYSKVDTAVSNLSMKLLIKVDDEGTFDMHDHLRDLGRTIAEEEKQGTRVWEGSHLSTLAKDINFSRIQLNGGNLQSLEMLYRPDLCYLHLQNVHIESMTEDTRAMLLSSLIWLRLENCTFATRKNGVINNMLTAIKKTYRVLRKKGHSRFEGNNKQLKIMQLYGPSNLQSRSSLFSFLNVQQIQYLDLRRCMWLVNLPHTIGNLSQLKHLDLRDCRNLNYLPDNIGNLAKLQHLDLRDCRSLFNIPDTIGNLSQLQHLDLTDCTELGELPDIIGNLSQLQHLDLTGCLNLYILPDSIGNLSELKHLDLAGCRYLNDCLPDAIGNLSQLQHLDLSWCRRLNSLPYTIGNLSQLQHLNLKRYGKLENLPNTIGNLSQLQHLDLTECESLSSLPDTIGNLSQLQLLNLKKCYGLHNVPNTIGNLSQLKHLILRDCSNLNDLPDTIGNLSQLQQLDLSGCASLKNLPSSIGKLSQLQHLDLTGCESLKNLPDTIGNLLQLQHLDLTRVERLNKLPDTIGNLSQLQNLDLSWCQSLKNLPDTIGNLSQLQHLDLKRCKRLSNLPHTIGNLSQLQHLDLSWCQCLKIRPDIIGNLSATCTVKRF